MKTFILALALGAFSLSSFASCGLPWICETLKMPVPYNTLTEIKFVSADIRAGYLPHEGEFKGNVIFFEGLGDSMLNHDPLFKKISRAGYRVIAFDYMGQGGSTGSMNKTRIEYIPWIGERVWNKFALNKDKFNRKNVIGWSTGGLAAYYAASEFKADKVILIAPGISPNKIVGEGLFNEIPDEITIETLTTDVYFDRASNPHRDEIRPRTPLAIPEFSIDLMSVAKKMRSTKISENIKGLVLLSGEDDSYVNPEKTKKAVQKNAPHFKIKTYAGALHEIDNERKEIRDVAHQDILNFLLSGK